MDRWLPIVLFGCLDSADFEKDVFKNFFNIGATPKFWIMKKKIEIWTKYTHVTNFITMDSSILDVEHCVYRHHSSFRKLIFRTQKGDFWKT